MDTAIQTQAYPSTLLTVAICFPSTYSLTHSLYQSMKQSPSWEANQFAASQEIPRILWNLKVYYHIHKCPPLVPILSQLNPVHIPHPTSWISSHLRLGFPSGLFPSGLPTKTLYTPLMSAIRASVFLPFTKRKYDQIEDEETCGTCSTHTIWEMQAILFSETWRQEKNWNAQVKMAR